jgi:hypothetical protein
MSQLSKTVFLCNSTILKYINALGITDGAKTMGDRNSGYVVSSNRISYLSARRQSAADAADCPPNR